MEFGKGRCERFCASSAAAIVAQIAVRQQCEVCQSWRDASGTTSADVIACMRKNQ